MSDFKDDPEKLKALVAEVKALVPRVAEFEAEMKRLRERLGPRELEVVEIDKVGHYVNVKVRDHINYLREGWLKQAQRDAAEIVRLEVVITDLKRRLGE